MTITFRTPHRIPSPRVAPSTRPRGLTPVTGPIPDTLTGRILLLVDAENLVLSARDLDVALDFEALRAAFARYDRRQVECHAVYSQDIGDGPLAVHLVRRGWHPTPRPRSSACPPTVGTAMLTTGSSSSPRAASALLGRKRTCLRREGMAGIGQALTTLRSDSYQPVPRPLRELYGGLVIGYRDDRSFLTRVLR